ncbi:MAG TPA: chloride channel protein, partial [Acidimicrobiales bacterium]
MPTIRRLATSTARGIVFGCGIGVIAGLSAAAFLDSLRWATTTREDHSFLLWILPLAGLVIGLIYDRYGGRAAKGNDLLIDEVHEPTAWVPRRMAPMIFGASVVTHLFGGSAGREGAGIQLAGGLTDHAARLLNLEAAERRLMLIAAISAGFAAVFGMPWAGWVFGLEVQFVRRVRLDAVVPALVGSIVGNLVVRGVGTRFTVTPHLGPVAWSPALVGKILVAGALFGVTAWLFATGVHEAKRLAALGLRWVPLRPVIGAFVVIGLTYAVGNRDYLGLSTPLIDKALAGGAGIIAAAFALKFLFTVITLGAGFQGGEVTPLFVIGATLGVTLGR